VPSTGHPAYVAVPYLDRMDLAFALADLIVSRAGAATVSELTALGLPAVYVPYAVGNGEQARNAAAVTAGAARLIPDAQFTADRVRAEIVPLLEDAGAQDAMRAAAARIAPAHATVPRTSSRRSTARWGAEPHHTYSAEWRVLRTGHHVRVRVRDVLRVSCVARRSDTARASRRRTRSAPRPSRTRVDLDLTGHDSPRSLPPHP
jgi:hypothetical protein